MIVRSALAAILALSALAPLRAIGQAVGSAGPPKQAYFFDERVGLAHWKDNQGCLMVSNSSIATGSKVTLVNQPASGEPPGIREASVVERLPRNCDSGLSGPGFDSAVPSYYRVASADVTSPSGVMFAIVEPLSPIVVLDGRIEADLDADGAKESFRVCASTESLHFMIWTGPPAQGRPRWHSNYNVGFDMDPSCTDQDIAGMEVLEKPRPSAGARARFPQYTGTGELPPQRFGSRVEAEHAGCLFRSMKGPGADTCILGAYASNVLDISVYDRSPEGDYAVVDAMTLPSQYWETTLSLVDVIGKHTDWLVIETTGMHGTGIHQRVLFVIGWDGARFRTVAAESLDYSCYRPASAEDYALHVGYAFDRQGVTPRLVLNYELTRDGQNLGKWSDQLRWNASLFAFALNQSRVDATDPVVRLIRAKIARVRAYSARNPMSPANGSDNWIDTSGLIAFLDSAACSSPPLR